MREPLITQTNLPPGFIDLGLGNPDLDLLPLDLVHRSAEACFTAGDARPLQYGLEQGDGYFRRALAAFLSERYGSPVMPERLFISAGASSALDLLCTLYTRPGDTIFVEEPSYFLALRIFADHGLRLVPIPMDEGGLRLDILDEQLSQSAPRLLYTVPTYQNPSGRTLSAARRLQLVERAQRYNFLVVADEVYHFLSYDHAPPDPLAVHGEGVEQVVSVSSFSKILAPGLRLGWVQAQPGVIRRLAGCGLLESGGGMNPWMSALARGLVESGGLGENISALRRTYADRLARMDAALRRHLPAAEYERPQGGFFFWVRLPGVDTGRLRGKAQAQQVDFRPGSLFSPGSQPPSGSGVREYIRLSFCYYPPENIEMGIQRLAACIKG